MVTLVIAFYILVGIFALIGSMRGWGKEILVSFSVILGLALIAVVEDLLPYTKDVIQDGSELQFWIRFTIIVFMVFFGYQSPKLSQLARATERRDRIQDWILGLIFGAINGYLIFGTLWYFMDEANYPFAPYIISPMNDPITADTAQRLLKYFAPALLSGYWIYIAVVIAFIFVIIVFI